MAEEKRRREGEEEAELEYQGALIKVDPIFAERNIFEKIAGSLDQQVLKAMDEVIENLGGRDIEASTIAVKALSYKLKSLFIDPVLGQIIHPIHGKEILMDRIELMCDISLSVLQQRLQSLIDKIKTRQYSPDEDIGGKLAQLLYMYEILTLALRETMNQLLTLFHINVPPTKRPPLANVKIGFDIG